MAKINSYSEKSTVVNDDIILMSDSETVGLETKNVKFSTISSQVETDLGLGTSATVDTGTTDGTIPLIGTGDLLDSSIIPDLTKSKISDFTESDYVHTTGDESISGIKTFSVNPISSTTPTTDTELANKGYADSLILDSVEDTEVTPGFIANHVVIAEFRKNNNPLESYIVLYNPTSSAIDLTNYTIRKNASGTWLVAYTITSGTIAAHSYFLLGESAGCAGITNDITTGNMGFFVPSSASVQVAIYDSTSTRIDTLTYGSPNTNNLLDDDGNIATSFATYPGWLQTNKRNSNSSGYTEGQGNGYDTNQCGDDFFVNATPTPKNSSSSTEEYTLTSNIILRATLSDYETSLNNNNDIPNKKYVDDEVGAVDSILTTHTGDSTIHFTEASISIPLSQISDYSSTDFVHTSGDESVAGLKTFSTLPQQDSYVVPTIDTEFATKKYVDDSSTSGSSYWDRTSSVLTTVNAGDSVTVGSAGTDQTFTVTGSTSGNLIVANTTTPSIDLGNNSTSISFTIDSADSVYIKGNQSSNGLLELKGESGIDLYGTTTAKNTIQFSPEDYETSFIYSPDDFTYTWGGAGYDYLFTFKGASNGNALVVDTANLIATFGNESYDMATEWYNTTGKTAEIQTTGISNWYKKMTVIPADNDTALAVTGEGISVPTALITGSTSFDNLGVTLKAKTSDLEYVELVKGRASASGTNVFQRNLSSTGTSGPVVQIKQDHASDDQPAVWVRQDAAIPAVKIDSYGQGIYVNNLSSGDVGIAFTGASTTQGDVQFSLRSSDPTSPSEGQIWWNTTDKKLRIYNGSTVVDLN